MALRVVSSIVAIGLAIGGARRPPEPASAPPPVGCGSAPLAVVLGSPVELPCFPERDCSQDIAIEVTNCTDAPRDVTTVSACDPHDCIEAVMPVSLRPHGRARLLVPKAFHHGAGWVRVFSIEVGATIESPSRQIDFTITDPRLERAKADCAAHGGDWGHWGMLGTEACVPVMHDAGRACVDGRECEGYCRMDKRVRVTKSWDRVTGHCTRHRLRFGCNTFIGETKGGLVSANMYFVRSCVD